MGGQVLTLHKESAQQLISGYRFDFCSQVDVSAHYQRSSPEPENPEDGMENRQEESKTVFLIDRSDSSMNDA